VHAVDVGVGRDDDPVVAQAVEAVLDVECGLEEVEFLVLVDDLLGEAVGVERLALEGEDGLGLDVARGGEGAGGESPSTMKRVIPRRERCGRRGGARQSRSFLLWREAFLARSRAMLRMPASSFRSCSFSSILSLA
jgi:hypothetical protein